MFIFLHNSEYTESETASFLKFQYVYISTENDIIILSNSAYLKFQYVYISTYLTIENGEGETP